MKNDCDIKKFSKEDEAKFHEFLEKFKADDKLMLHLQSVQYEELFNYAFLADNSEFSSLDDIVYRSGFGIMSPLEINNVPEDKWDEYISKYTGCEKWHDFGKLAMISWMEKVMKEEKGNSN